MKKRISCVLIVFALLNSGCSAVTDTNTLADTPEKATSITEKTTPDTTAVSDTTPLWINSKSQFRDDVLSRISDTYHATVHSGIPGTSEYNLEFHEWIREQSGVYTPGQIDDYKMNDTMVLDIVSTISFSADWTKQFLPENNTVGSFYTEKRTEQCTFMHGEFTRMFYRGGKFQAVTLSLRNSSVMLLLPDEGVTSNGADSFLPVMWSNQRMKTPI